MSLLEELRRRKVFRVAAVYAIVAWLTVQVVDVIIEPLQLPAWFDTVTILFLAIGFPVALILAWAFDIGPQGLTRTTDTERAALTGHGKTEVLLLFVLVVGIGWLVARDVANPVQSSGRAGDIPVVILMDTFAPRGVYDEETRQKSGTNADVLSDVLRDLPILTQKEAIGSTWDRETQILKQNPRLVLIHRSGFFHSMNLELRFGYPNDPATYSAEDWGKLYAYADNKLMAFIGFIGSGNPRTRFLVYSRGTGGEWIDPEFRKNWIRQIEGRFPALAGRVTAIDVPGGVAGGSFRDADTAANIRQHVQALLQAGNGKP